MFDECSYRAVLYIFDEFGARIDDAANFTPRDSEHFRLFTRDPTTPRVSMLPLTPPRTGHRPPLHAPSSTSDRDRLLDANGRAATAHF